MDLKNSLIELARLFEKEKVDYALCGGLALAVHGYPRATRDLDLLIGAEDLLKVRGFKTGILWKAVCSFFEKELREKLNFGEYPREKGTIC